MTEKGSIQGSRFIVTGGAGFIGSHIVDALLENGSSVWVIDNFSTGLKQNLSKATNSKDLTILKEDILHFDQLHQIIKQTSPDAIIHLAALASVPYSIQAPTLVNEANVKGTLNILEAARELDVPKIIFASSSSVYGDSIILPKNEDMPCKPISPYGVTKLAGESYCHAYHKVYGLPTVALRFFNVFGPRQLSSPYNGVVSIFINRMLQNIQPTIYGDGYQTRDFTFVLDVVLAIHRLLTVDQGYGDVFNISMSSPVTINSLVVLINKLLKTTIQPLYTERRKGDIAHSFADISKAKKILSWAPQYSLEEGVTKTIAWAKEQRRDI